MENFFATNRNLFEASLKGGVAVLTAYAGMQRGNDMAFGFEQEANFWWLTGLEEADWWLIIDASRHKSWLVAPSVSESHQIFDGTTSPEKAKEISGADEVISHDDAKSLLRDMAKKHSVVHTLAEQPYAEYLDFTLNPAGKKMYDMLSRTFRSVQDCRKDLAKIRAIKRLDEIARMKKAINMTVGAFQFVKQNLDKYTYEYEIEAEFTHYFRTRGAKGHAYDPIVASGGNACTLHYGANAMKLKKRGLLLIDIGASSEGYAADITRTYAIGEPTKRQREVHVAVQTAQRDIIALLSPDLSLEELQRFTEKRMTEALMSLGLMHNAGDEKALHRYFPHAIGHGLGVDVHESLGAPRTLLPGMVLTVEPGIYIPEEEIGVRIEDNILITDKGHTNLSGRLSTDL